MIKKTLLFVMLLLPTAAMDGQVHLDSYIAEGLKNNLSLQQEEFSLEKSLAALKEARGMFLPTISIQARYSRAGGGRMIYFPVGDMLNPIHSSLNSLFQYHDIVADFPTDIPNEQIPFLREKEQETKIRVVQPIYQRAIFHNVKLKSALNRINQARVNVFKRQLITDIKTAYFNYAKALQVAELLDQTRALLEENLRVSENLVKHGKATEDVVYRAKAELADLDLQNAEAEKNKTLAAAYFNFLLNRNLEEPIQMDKIHSHPLPEKDSLETAIVRALSLRQESQQLNHAITAASHQIGLAKSRSLPALLAVLDYGIQGEQYSLGKDDDYWMASLVLEWTLFNGNQNRTKKTQAMLDKKKLELQRLELEEWIKIQVHEAHSTLKAARLAVSAAEEKEESARQSYAIVAKKYKNGMEPQITLLDARNTLTNASINRIMTLYDFYIKKAKFERASASIDLDKYRENKGENNE
ncbi:MAG: TolC family protein [Candidatus Aminicenantes bacterium]|jgi:outer membrane protein TolC